MPSTCLLLPGLCPSACYTNRSSTAGVMTTWSWDLAGAPVQGLFHPARKVRETYWRIYNNLYIGAQDSLVSAYPRLADDGMNTYARHELDLFI